MRAGGVQRAADVMRFERKSQDFQYGKTPISLAFLTFCMGSFEVRGFLLKDQRSLSVVSRPLPGTWYQILVQNNSTGIDSLDSAW